MLEEEDAEKLVKNIPQQVEQVEDQQAPETPQDENSSNIKQDKSNKISIVDKWKEIMKATKDKTGIDGIYVILFLLLCVILVYLGIFGSLITNLVATVYPGFSTIKSIEKKSKKKEWLTYWAVYGSFIIVDMFSNIIMKIVPFYFVFKILFLIWMVLPGSNGCALVYHFLIFKLFKSIEGTVDFFFAESKDIANQIYKGTKNAGGQQIKKIAQGLKTFKPRLGLGKKNEMNDNLETVKQSEAQKMIENPMYGKQFNSTIDFLSINRKKKENKENKINHLKENKPIIEEETDKKQDLPNNIINKENQDKKDEKIDNSKENMKNILTQIRYENENEEKNMENNEEDNLEFSDEIIEDEKKPEENKE